MQNSKMSDVANSKAIIADSLFYDSSNQHFEIGKLQNIYFNEKPSAGHKK